MMRFARRQLIASFGGGRGLAEMQEMVGDGLIRMQWMEGIMGDGWKKRKKRKKRKRKELMQAGDAVLVSCARVMLDSDLYPCLPPILIH